MSDVRVIHLTLPGGVIERENDEPQPLRVRVEKTDGVITSVTIGVEREEKPRYLVKLTREGAMFAHDVVVAEERRDLPREEEPQAT
jgi:hypothetical protein